MGLIADLLSSVGEEAALFVTRAVAGPRFTAIAVSTDPRAVAPLAAGLAYTGLEDVDASFDALAASAALQASVAGRPAYEVAQAIAGRDAAHHLPAAIAGADTADAGAGALNALLAAEIRARGRGLPDENGLDLIARLGAGKRLAVVGSFPYLKAIRLEAAHSWVLELDPAEDELPASAAPEILPQADVVGITGSTLANGTLEGLLALCRRAAFVAIIGPTTPLSPVLFDYGADVLCGSLVEDPQVALASVLAGGSTRRIPGTRQVSLRP